MTLLAAQVGPYRIVDRLGAGGMGEVFLAEDTRLGRRVALKTLSNSGSRPAEARHKLLREARAAAHLNHPNIAAVYDVLDSGDDAHIVMEYVAGETLAAIVQRGPLPVATAVDIGVQLADAMAEAHAVGIVHRDLKPANVCLTASGRVKILDFGLAQSHAFDLSATTGPLDTASVQRPIVGTPQYIPPEHLLGGSADDRGDLYSLGVTLFELLTGTRPFGGADLVSLVSEVLHAPTPRVSERRRDVNPRLDALVYRAMARRPDERFATARELLAELRFVQDEITHPDVSSVVALPPAPRVAPRSWGVALAGLAVVVVAAGAAWWASTRAVAPAPGTPVVVAVLPFAGPPDETLGAGLSDVLTAGLTRLPGITVIGRSAVAEANGGGAVETARRLGATHVVDGRVQDAGGRVRLSAQLVRVDTGAVAWAGSYEGARNDVLSVERTLAQELAHAVAPAATAAVDAPPTRDTEAFADYSQGWSFLDRPDVPGNLERARDAFARAAARDPSFARAHAGLGQALLRLFSDTRDPKHADAARAALTEALRLQPDDGTVRYVLASVFMRTGRRSDALVELQRAISAQPTFDEAWARRGQLLADGGDVAGGVASLEEAIRLRPSLWKHHLDLGTVLFRASRYDAARARFQRATELQPDSSWGFQMLGTTHHVLGDLDAAIAAYKHATTLGADEKAWDNLGTAYYQQGRFDLALDAYRRSAAIRPTSVVTHHNLGDLYARLGRPAESRAAYETALRLARESAAAHAGDGHDAATAALVLAKLKRHAEAAAQLSLALAVAPGDGEVLHFAAVVHALAGRPDDAIATLERAIATGYSRAMIREDEFLAGLRADPRFVRLVMEPPKDKTPGGAS